MSHWITPSATPCFACGNTYRALIDVGALNSAKACGQCLMRFGPKNLKREAERILANTSPRRREPACLHCGAPLILMPDGRVPGWCQECEAERRRIAGQ